MKDNLMNLMRGFDGSITAGDASYTTTPRTKITTQMIAEMLAFGAKHYAMSVCFQTKQKDYAIEQIQAEITELFNEEMKKSLY